MKILLDWYLRQLATRPWTTQACTTGFLFLAGDVIAQQAVEKRGFKGHLWRRTVTMTGVGFCIAAPVLRGWYLQLEKLVPANTRLVAVKKMALDQTIFAPTFLAGFFSILGLLEGQSVGQIKQRFEQDYVSSLKTNYMVWPGVQMITFYVIPLQHRVTFVNFVALGWNTYLAWKAHH